MKYFVVLHVYNFQDRIGTIQHTYNCYRPELALTSAKSSSKNMPASSFNILKYEVLYPLVRLGLVDVAVVASFRLCRLVMTFLKFQEGCYVFVKHDLTILEIKVCFSITCSFPWGSYLFQLPLLLTQRSYSLQLVATGIVALIHGVLK